MRLAARTSRIRFQTKLLLALLAVLVITASSISWIWYSHSRHIVIDTTLQSTELLLNDRIREIDSVITDIDYQSRLLSYNNPAVDRGIGNKWQYPYLNALAVTKLNNYIDSIYASSLSIKAIELANSKGDFYGRGERRGYAYMKSQGIIDRLRQHSDELLVLPYFDTGDNVKEIMFIRNVHYYGKIIGYCMISIDYDTFQNAFEGIFPAHTMIEVNNSAGDLLYASPNLTNGHAFDKVALTGQGIQLSKDGKGQEWLMLGQEISNENIYVHVAVPMKGILSNITSKFKDILYITLAMSLILLLIVLALSKRIGRNMSMLSNAIKKFSEGDMVHTLTIRGNDEFSKVAVSFNEMKQNIKQLLEDIKAREREKVELEVRALQGQINMHFLFNTLNTIKNLSYIQRVTNIERLVGALMELLHLSMADGKNFITLEAEMNYVNYYLEIYKYKSVKQIECHIQLDSKIKDAVIPKFMLQPIVENAIIHGIESSDEDKDGLIWIRAGQEKDRVHIEITDNGKGFDGLDVRSFNGIGIANTDQRIKVHFGEQYGIRVESVPNVSTTVHIEVPYRRGLAS